MSGREKLDESFSCIQRVDVAYTLKVILCQTLTKISRWSWWKWVIKVIQMADWEPYEM